MNTPNIAAIIEAADNLIAWRAQGCQEADPHDTYPDDLWLAAASPENVKALVAEVERLRAQVAQSADALRLLLDGTQEDCGSIRMPSNAAVRAGFAALSAAPAQQDAELAAALGWPGGITNDPPAWPEMLRAVMALRLAQQAAQVAPAGWIVRDRSDIEAGAIDIEGPGFGRQVLSDGLEGMPLRMLHAFARSHLSAAPAQQADPLDLRDDVIATLRHELAQERALCDERGSKLDELYAQQDAAQQAEPVALPEFHDPRVQAAYAVLADSETEPPAGEHWEGFSARRIVAAIDALPHPPAQGVDERGAFEAWCKSEELNVNRASEEGIYVNSGTWMAWHAWQARAAIGQAPTAKEQP